jgi:GTP-binding protein YchF
MPFSIGIVGLPNVGKSTLFKTLTGQQVEIAPRPFTTIKPNYGVVVVPDKRLKRIAEAVRPEKIVPTVIEFIDIAGLVKNAWKGEGLGNEFLSQIRNCDALLEIIRVFENERIQHVEKNLDSQRDADIVKVEFLMKDLEVIEKSLPKLERKTDKLSQKKARLLRRIKENIGRGIKISEISLDSQEKQLIKEFQFLTEKPLLLIVNSGSKNAAVGEKLLGSLNINLKLEEEANELSDQEIEELKIKKSLPKLIVACYQILGLITFYTIAGGKEVRAWTLAKNSTAAEAAGLVHSDFEDKFIRAITINWQQLIRAGGWAAAQKKGLLISVGRKHVVRDGDVIEFRI